MFLAMITLIHVKGTSVLSPSIPLTLVVLPALMIAQKSPDNIFTEHASVYILAFGMVAAKITNKLVVSLKNNSIELIESLKNVLVIEIKLADSAYDESGDGVSGLVAIGSSTIVPESVL